MRERSESEACERDLFVQQSHREKEKVDTHLRLLLVLKDVVRILGSCLRFETIGQVDWMNFGREIWLNLQITHNLVSI